MLHRNPLPRSADYGDAGQWYYERDYITLGDVTRFIRRYLLTIALTFLVPVLAAAVYVKIAEPIFTARAQLLIDPSTTQMLRDRTGGVELSLDTAQVEGHIAVLRSETVAARVIADLDLEADPEFRGKQPSVIGRLAAPLRRVLGRGGDDGAGEASDFTRSRIAIATFLTNLDVRRVGLSYAIDISFSSTDPEKAARVANAVARTYVQDQLDTMARAARHSSEWLEARIHQLRAQLNKAARAVQRFRSGHDYRPAGRPQGGGPLPDMPAGGDPVTLVELEATAASYRQMYESYLRAFTEAVQRQSFSVSNTRIITPATRPLGKSHPRSKLVVAFGMLVGLLAGLGVAFLRHSFDGSVRAPQQIRERLGLECFAQIPRLEKARRRSRPKIGGRAGDQGEEQTADPRFRAVIEAPFAPFAGALKTVTTAIVHADKSRTMRCVGVTSALPREGKSTVASNLAALFSVSAGKTLIIDTDIHNATLSRNFAPRAEQGLIEVLTEAAACEACIVSGIGAEPDILPVVVAEDRPISYDLLGLEPMRRLLGQLRKSYDMVIVDLPPLNPIVDGLVISALLDGVVLVVEWGETPLDLLADVTTALHRAHAKMLGTVMTKVDGAAGNIRWTRSRG